MSTLFPIIRHGRNNTNYNSRDVFSMFDDLFTTDMPSRSHRKYNTTPRANVIKTNEGYGIELAVPGFSRDEFEMYVDNDTLTISMKTEDSKEYEDSMLHREYRFSNFKRSFSLPDNASVENISARYESGILYVNVPVEEKSCTKRIISVE